MTEITSSKQTANKLRYLANKVPEITLYFWLIKVLCTTIGETFSDDLVGTWAGGDNASVQALNSALLHVTFITAGLTAITLFYQFTRKKYIAWVYWLNIVMIAVLGTQITDNFEGNGDKPNHMVAITVVSLILLAAVFFTWWYVERTLSMHSIKTRRREAFYWLAITTTFAAGTAVGDLVAEQLNLGYLTTLLLFTGVIAAIAVVWKLGRFNSVLMFWLAYIMTRPLGASTGDFLSQQGNQGLNLGVHMTTYVFLSLIVLLVAFLQIKKSDVTPKTLTEDAESE